ncbi:MAG: hypothetical protein ACD_37C00434G0001 [uncultured bacterium]|nr:MAG: hypothetical protein ACD_37C00434G0001 [uncultured bacterium]
MLNFFVILFGKAFISLSKLLNLGNGSTWPGHIALNLNSNFVKDLLRSNPRGRKLKALIIAGTNGKTTTGKLITEILRSNGNSVIENASGANLLNGLASAIIKGSSLFDSARPGLAVLKQDYLIFETDENALPQVLNETNADYVICLNLFRDQLDRYGEIDSIAKKWHSSFEKLGPNTTLILNADDPQIAYLADGIKAKTLYFGLSEKGNDKTLHGADSTHCPKCLEKLEFETVFFSHLGIWKCPNCKLKRPTTDIEELSQYPLEGKYNKYNALAASLFATNESIGQDKITISFNNFTPAFGRQEKLTYKGKNVQIFLSKNPTSFNESLSTVKDLKGKDLLILLNDRIPDGLDVSWIWDINFEEILNKEFNVGVSGDRVYDMALRLKYAEQFTHIDPDPKVMLNKMVEALKSDETLYILPNYSAMLDIRKILTGRKIL